MGAASGEPEWGGAACSGRNRSDQVPCALVVRIANRNADAGCLLTVERGANSVGGDRSGRTGAMTGPCNEAGLVNCERTHGVVTNLNSQNHGAAGGTVSPVQSTWA
jgi:hypothetical protein